MWLTVCFVLCALVAGVLIGIWLRRPPSLATLAEPTPEEARVTVEAQQKKTALQIAQAKESEAITRMAASDKAKLADDLLSRK